jgi:hypothetical protein
MRNAYKRLVGLLEAKRPVGRTRHYGKIILKGIVQRYRWEGVDSIKLAKDRTSGGVLLT